MLHRRLRAGDDGRRLGRGARACPAVDAVPRPPGRARDLNLSDTDLADVKAPGGRRLRGARAALPKDPAVGKRFERLTEEIGDKFIRVELEGRGHSTVTEHRQQVAVDAVLEFFAEKRSPS